MCIDEMTICAGNAVVSDIEVFNAVGQHAKKNLIDKGDTFDDDNPISDASVAICGDSRFCSCLLR